MTREANIRSRIFVVEDHVIVREGFIALINHEPDLEACGEAESAAEALSLIARTKPDLVVVDLVLREGNGLDLIKSSRALYPNLPILVISMQDEDVFAERCLRAGASGYIMKRSASESFLDAIRTILKGEVYVSDTMNQRMLRRVAGIHDAHEKKTRVEKLSDRELQVYQMTGAGMAAREIAPHMGISPKTVATHRKNIKEKLGLKNGQALTQSAIHWSEIPTRTNAGAGSGD